VEYRKKSQSRRKERDRSKRRASVLIVVLVVIMMLTLACYQFVELMLTERQATEMYGRRVAARAFADSGVQWVAAMLHSNDDLQKTDYYHNPALFQGQLMVDSEIAHGRGKFTILAPVENDTQFSGVRFGLIDESGKLNLNAILKIVEEYDDADERARDILLAIPSMTEDIADSILDWIDGDDDTREFGAESDYYSTLAVPYETKNGKLESLDELLMVRGVTPELLYGHDKNRNGLIDPSELSSESERGEGVEIGFHPLGWSAMLTVFSRESNLRSDGSAKVDLNQDLLTELYDELMDEFGDDGNGEDIAKFVVAYRMNGPSNLDDATAALENSSIGRASQSFSGGEQDAVQNLANEAINSAISGDEPVTRGGMDLRAGASLEINSIYDLIDVEVEVEINGVMTTLSSPWTSSEMTSYLPDLLERSSVSGEKFLEGRINVNQTRTEVLEGILTGALEEDDTTNIADIVDRIMDSRSIDESGQPLSQGMEDRATTAWLVIDGIVDLPLMRRLDRYLTTGGDVYRVYSVGHFDSGGPVARVEAVIDATQNPPRIVYERDLSDLGRGYSMSQLGISEQ